MGKIFKYGLLLFIVSVLIGYFIGKFYPIVVANNKQEDGITNIVGDTVKTETSEEAFIETANLDEKLLPAATLTIEKKFQDCKHTIITESELPTEMANLTEEDIIQTYSDWSVKDFSKEGVTLYKIVQGICGEHFVVNSDDGIVTVYRLDSDYNKSLYEKTNIFTEYLSSEDIEKLDEGIYVYGTSDLNSILENFE
jgi:hypothetical protein